MKINKIFLGVKVVGIVWLLWVAFMLFSTFPSKQSVDTTILEAQKEQIIALKNVAQDCTETVREQQSLLREQNAFLLEIETELREKWGIHD